jgi:hypothetical protein
MRRMRSQTKKPFMHICTCMYLSFTRCALTPYFTTKIENMRFEMTKFIIFSQKRRANDNE